MILISLFGPIVTIIIIYLFCILCGTFLWSNPKHFSSGNESKNASLPQNLACLGLSIGFIFLFPHFSVL